MGREKTFSFGRVPQRQRIFQEYRDGTLGVLPKLHVVFYEDASGKRGRLKDGREVVLKRLPKGSHPLITEDQEVWVIEFR